MRRVKRAGPSGKCSQSGRYERVHQIFIKVVGVSSRKCLRLKGAGEGSGSVYSVSSKRLMGLISWSIQFQEMPKTAASEVTLLLENMFHI